MRFITARELPNEYVFEVHIDPTKTVNGQPDPAYVDQFVFGKEPPPGRTDAEYLADCQREVKALCALKLTQRNARAKDVRGTRLSIEGESL